MAATGTPGLAEFLACDDTVLAVMAAAVDVVEAAGMPVETATNRGAHLHRALHWQRYSRGPVSSLHRALRRRHRRGSLRLLRRVECQVTDVDQRGDPVGAVDALVAGVDPGLAHPASSAATSCWSPGRGWRG